MAIPAETLNAQLRASEVQTGVYLNKQRKSCVVVKVSKEGIVHFLTLTDSCTIELAAHGRDRFLQDWPIQLYHYPALRAIRSYARYVVKDGFRISEPARKVINAVLAR